jgi:hypothetical protein
MTNLLGDSKFGTFQFEYTCSTYTMENFVCSDQYTDWADPGSANSLLALSSHIVKCPDETSLQGLEGETKYNNGFNFRFHYVVSTCIWHYHCLYY